MNRSVVLAFSVGWLTHVVSITKENRWIPLVPACFQDVILKLDPYVSLTRRFWVSRSTCLSLDNCGFGPSLKHHAGLFGYWNLRRREEKFRERLELNAAKEEETLRINPSPHPHRPKDSRSSR